MQSSSTSLQGTRFRHITDHQGKTLLFAADTPWERGWVNLNVANGNVQGDRKTPNPFFFEKTVQTRSAGNCTEWGMSDSSTADKFWGYTSQSWGDYPVPAEVLMAHADPFDFTGLYERALAKIFDQVRGNGEVIIDLIEAPKTVGMFKGLSKAAKGVSTILSGIVRRGRDVPVRERLNYLSERWLEYQYGWKPLLSSAYSLFDAFMKEHQQGEKVLRARARNVSDRVAVEEAFWGIGFKPTTKRHTFRRSCRIELEFRFKIEDSFIQDITSLNPLTIAWELVPFSFVADWFVSIGDSLRNLENWWLYAPKFLGGRRTWTGLSEVTSHGYAAYGGFRVRQPQWPNIAFSAGQLISCHSSERVTRLHREVLTTLPMPSGPRFRVKFGPEKALTSVALVQQAVGKTRNWSR